MQLYRIRQEFDDLIRTARLDEMTPLRDRWINQGWERIAEAFVIPSLNKTVTIGSVINQQFYPLPYDYNGTEIGLMYGTRRLDPVPDETLRLKYERRTGNFGSVRYYDWSGVVGADLIQIQDVVLTNGLKAAQTSSIDTVLSQDYWVRFDPYADSNNSAHDLNDMVDPGDYGYQIEAGSFVPGVGFNLMTEYRGPSGSFTMRVRPSETQQFIVYGIPPATDASAFSLRYSAKPKRLYNDSDVPELPNMGEAIAYMAGSVALEWHHNMETARQFWGRAMSRAEGLQKRRNKSQTLVSDLTIGSVSGRQTGVRGIFITRGSRSGVGRFR